VRTVAGVAIDSHPDHPFTVNRRAVVGGGMAAGLLTFFGRTDSAGASAEAMRALPSPSPSRAPGAPSASALGFGAIAPNQLDHVTVPDGYVVQVLIPWGDPIVPGGPAFSFAGTNTAAEQAQQFGMGHDGMHFFRTAAKKGVLVINHEAVDHNIMFDSAPDWSDPEVVLKSQNAHGVAVCELELRGGVWTLVSSKVARRITPLTPRRLTGPAAGHPSLVTGADPTGSQVLGTVNNCANGATLWGTYLTCEENFNGYFGSDDPTFTPTDLMLRYGVSTTPFNASWYKSDLRFALDQNPNEPNRFGWVVEIDPFDPVSIPAKRTALGRLKHENAAFAEANDGRAVVYTGDDEVFQFVYKYVAAQPWKKMRAKGISPLDEGTLYAARFDSDGTGTWIPLSPTTAPSYADLASILIDTRGAAAEAGATPMDRPEWIAVHPHLAGVAYGTFTNNRNRTTTNVANPRTSNRNGHILRWQSAGGDHGSETFVWSVFALAGTGLGTGDGSTIAPGDAFGSPDGLAFDPNGRLWIQTDGGQPIPCNNQMLVADPSTGDLRRFLVGPKGCEITGWTMTDDQRTLFVNIQHPGENAPVGDPDFESNWPDFQGRPRSATLAIRKADGGVIGA
jgi:uncharacterized protein